MKFEAKHIEVFQAEEDADMLVITTAIRKASDFQVVIIADEDVDLLIILTGHRGPTQGTIYLQKCGRSKMPHIFYSTTSTSAESQLITFSRAFSGCDSTSCFFGQGKRKLIEILEKHVDLNEKVAVFSNPTAAHAQVAEAGEKILIELYGGESSSQTLNDLSYQLFTETQPRPVSTCPDFLPLKMLQSYIRFEHTTVGAAVGGFQKESTRMEIF